MNNIHPRWCLPHEICFLSDSGVMLCSQILFLAARKDGRASPSLRLGLWGVCGSIALLQRWVPWYGQYSFAVIWNWIRGAGERGRDDEEYQSFCLSCEVICGSTESAIMKVYLFTTEGLWVNLLSPWRRTWKTGSKCSVEEVLSIQSRRLLTSARRATAPAVVGG